MQDMHGVYLHMNLALMSMRSVAFAATLLSSVLIAAVAALPGRFGERNSAAGLHVYLGMVCGPATFIDDSRNIHLLLSANRSLRVNATELQQDQVALLLSRIMQYRHERNLLVSAEDAVPYGRVVELMAEVQQAVPDLNLMMLRDKPYEGVDETCFVPYAQKGRRRESH